MRILQLLTTDRPELRDLGLLVLRVALGAVMVVHGVDSVLNQPLSAVADNARGLGIPMPEASAVLQVYGQAIGGVLILLGLLTRVGGALVAVVMLGAWWFVHAGNGFFNQEGGFEYVMVLAAGGLALVLLGAGRFSLDAVLAARTGQPARQAARV